jgi:hypothetical protein
MKKNRLIQGILATVLFTCVSVGAKAGNEERAGEAGASELLINPWARSAGFAGANSATIVGLEAVNLNVAGLAQTRKSEFIFSNTSWLRGSGIQINSAGLAQKVGEAGVIGLQVMSMSFGDIEITTVDQPEGGIGSYQPQYLNIGLSYAKAFSNSIYGGVTFKSISQSTASLSAQTVAIDAGVKYITGKDDQIKFGIALRNVGPPLTFEGDGLSQEGTLPDGSSLTVEQRSAKAELPSLVNIGVSYDFFLSNAEDGGDVSDVTHKLTAAGNFTSNSFTQDQYRFGVEYGFKSMFMLRLGHVFQKDISDDEASTTALRGLTAGATVEVPLGKSGGRFGIDYGYRHSKVFDGIHTIGIRFVL